jgi:GT2 family glycosyltransferase
MSVNTHPTVAIIVLNWNAFEDTYYCIKSLKKVTYQNFSIILVDNDSTDGSYEKLKNEFPEIEVLQSGYDGGYAYGTNYGAKAALKQNAEYVMYLNNDTEVEPDFLDRIMDVFNNYENVGIVSSKILYMHDKKTLYCAGGKFRKFMCAGRNKFQGLDAVDHANEIEEIDFAEGCCMTIKREVFEKIGFMNDEYFMYFDDIDYSVRAIKHFKLYYTPYSILYHKTGAGLTWTDFTAFYYYYFTRNRINFYKNFFPLYWQMYSVFYSVLISLPKTFVILANNKEKGIDKKLKKVKAIWLGFMDGILGKKGVTF